MEYFCFKCRKETGFAGGRRPGRAEKCAACGADLHVCLNCRHYDQSAYNQCREPQAERVLDKDRGNFCDYFDFAQGKRAGSGGSTNTKQDALKKLDDLFK